MNESFKAHIVGHYVLVDDDTMPDRCHYVPAKIIDADVIGGIGIFLIDLGPYRVLMRASRHEGIYSSIGLAHEAADKKNSKEDAEATESEDLVDA